MTPGWRIVKTMGQKITKLRPIDGFCAETRRTLLLVLAMGLASFAAAQGRSFDMVRLLPAEVDGWKASGADRIFTPQTVASWKDGMGEACLRYAFSRLLVRTYAGPDGGLVAVEIYDMSDARDAYGLFTNDLEGEAAGVGRESLFKAGRLRFWKGPFFVRLSGPEGNAGIREALVGLGRRIASAIPVDPLKPKLVSCLPDDGLIRRSVRYFHRQESLDAAYFLADEAVLGLDATTEAVFGQYDMPSGGATVLVCRYPSEEAARRAFRRFSRDYFSLKADPASSTVLEKLAESGYAASRLQGRSLVLVLESPSKEACEALLGAVTARFRQVLPGTT